jgi:PKD repeat protein
MNHTLCRTLIFSVLLGLASSTAQATTYIWIKPAGGIWSDPTSWNPNGVPGPSDYASLNASSTYGFSRSAAYTITLTNSVVASNLTLVAHSSSNQTVTLNVGTNSLSLIKPGTSSPVALYIGHSSSSQNTLYLSSSTSAGAGLFITNAASLRATIGDEGTGVMIVTNGFVQVGDASVTNNQLVLGNNSASSSQGTLVLSGSSVLWSNNGAVLLGNLSSASGNSVVISNSAVMTCGGVLSVGGAGSSGNSILLDSGGQLFVAGAGASANVGNGSGSGNSATVQNGAIWDLGNTPLTIGTATGSGNSLTIGSNGTVSNAVTVVIGAGNSVVLSGGLLQAALGITNSAGTIAGSGTLVGEVVFTGGGTLSPGSGNTLGTIVAANDLTPASDTTVIKLDKSQAGSNDLINVTGVLTEAGALTVTNVGPALAGGDTFQIFTAGGFSGDFSATNLPALSGGLSWDTSQLGSAGIIAVPLVLSVVGPTNEAFNVGDTVTISATATGIPMPSLQWEFYGSILSDGPTGDGSFIAGSQTSTLTISNAQPGDAGYYCIIASNTGGTQTNCMYLSQIGGPTPPTIIGPSNQTVAQGNTATFSASVSGTPIPTIQWQQNGINISGATAATLVLTNVQASQDGYIYSIIASNSVAAATNSATLHVTVPNGPPALPVIPTNQFLITNYGAYGDGVSNNASAIQAAMKAAAAAGGGTVEVPAAGTLSNYLSGPIFLTNNVNLQVDSGAMLQALPKASWPSATTAFITATNVHDVEISGSGTIDGQGSGWWGSPSSTRPPLVQMAYTTRILIQNVNAQNPPFYHFRLIGGNTNITVQSVTINTETNSPNTDGVDISAVNALVQDCWIQDGDDDICIKNDTGQYSANIVVSNCTFNGGHGVSVGSDTAGGFNGFIVNNCIWNNTIYGIRCKSDNATSGSGAGGLVQNLGYYNLTMNHVEYPIIIYSYYNEEGTPDDVTPQIAAGESVGSTNHVVMWRNITFSNVTASVSSLGKAVSAMIWGRLEAPVSNLVFDAVNISPSNRTFTVFNAQGVQIVDSNLGVPIKTNTLTVFNAQVTVTNSVASTNLLTITGLAIPPTNNVLAFFNAPATLVTTNLLAPNPILTLGSSTLTVSNALNLGGSSTLNCALGTNATKIAVTGNLTLGGTLNVTDGGGFTSGTYTLFTYGGALTYNGLSIGATPSANYSYTVSTSTGGQVNLIVSNIVIAPVAGFTANPTNGTAPLAVSFTDIPSNSPTAWYWTFGDGGASSSENPSQTYTSPGTYTVVLIASNAGGSSTNTVVNCIAVLPPPPVAGFVANPLSGPAPLTVSFTDIPSNSPTAWYWTFGDGGVSSVESPTYTYVNPGSYPASLIASNADGASSPVAQTIGVYDPYQWWRLQYFGNTNSASGAPGADPYGKGISNTNQFLLGLNPINPASVFRILSAVSQSNDVVITWATGAGPTNVVQATGGDANGNYTTDFTDISGPLSIPGSGDATNSYLDAGGATNKPSHYYRIRLGP